MGIVSYKFTKCVMPGHPYGEFATLQDIAYVLSQMPMGTSVAGLELEPLGVSVLVRTIILKLHHTMFVDGKELIDSTAWTRNVAYNKDFTKIHEFNEAPQWNLDEICRKQTYSGNLEKGES